MSGRNACGFSGGDDEGALLAHDGTELVEGDGRGTLLEVDLLGSEEPQHVLTALGHSLNVDQVLHPHVLGDGVAAPGAAAQGQGRCQLKVCLLYTSRCV